MQNSVVKVLLVEDETSLADVLARNLRVRGHEVSVAGTAEEAVASIRSWRPHAVVLDINLPDDSGWEVYRRLNPDERERLHVVVISAAPFSQRRLEEFKPAHALQKPFPIDALARAVADGAMEDASWETQ